DRNRTGTAQAEGDKSGKIEEVRLVPRLSEMGASGIERLQLDRTKAVREMDREYCHEQDDHHRYRHERNERPDDDEQPTNDLHKNGRPTQQECGRNPDGVQDIDEILRAAGELRIAMLQEAQSNNQPKRNSIPRSRNG